MTVPSSPPETDRSNLYESPAGNLSWISVTTKNPARLKNKVLPRASSESEVHSKPSVVSSCGRGNTQQQAEH